MNAQADLIFDPDTGKRLPVSRERLASVFRPIAFDVEIPD